MDTEKKKAKAKKARLIAEIFSGLEVLETEANSTVTDLRKILKQPGI